MESYEKRSNVWIEGMREGKYGQLRFFFLFYTFLYIFVLSYIQTRIHTHTRTKQNPPQIPPQYPPIPSTKLKSL